MRRPLLQLVTLAAVTLISTTAAAQFPDLSKVQIKTEKIANNIYMMTGAGGNIGLSIGDDAVFIIDDQFAPLTGKIRAAIRKLTKKPIKFVFNTHWHFDHTGGNEDHGKAGAIIVAHNNVRKRMSTEQFIEFFDSKTPPSPKAALPVITFTTDISLYLNGDEIHVFHLPNAHTDGDAVIYFKTSDVIHTGDLFVNGFYPFIDSSSGGHIDGMIAAVDHLLTITTDKTKIIPGHGPLATKADLQAFRAMLATTSERIKAQLAAGKKVEDIIAAKPNADLDPQWGNGFLTGDKFVEMVARGLEREMKQKPQKPQKPEKSQKPQKKQK